MSESKFELGPIQKQWIASLRANPDRQLNNQLGRRTPDGSYTACCLGELGLIAGLCEWDRAILIVKGTTFMGFLNAVYVQVGLRSEKGHPRDARFAILSVMNDRLNTWPEIADIVEANPEQYFTISI